MTGTATTLDTALHLAALGYSVLPIKTDGTKAPAINSWKQYTQQAADENTIRAWFTDTTYDLGIIQGTVSGNAELTEIEGRAADCLAELTELATASGLKDLWTKVTTGWLEQSPSGGLHFHYRLAGMDVPGNQRLARRPSTPEELEANPKQRIQVLAETRGEGGQVVAYPSIHHTTGRTWTRLIGGPDTAPTLTIEERDAFHSILRTLDEIPPTPAPTPPTHELSGWVGGITPGDDFESKTPWTDILEGWTLVTGTPGKYCTWTRPGKTALQGISATTGKEPDRDRLYVFTSSTEFEQDVAYTKFGAYALLNHAGDHSAAAKHLYAKGFGKRAEQARILGPDPIFNDILEGTPWTPPTAHTATTPATSTPSESANTATAPTTANAAITSYERGPATYTATDDGNALRFIDTHKNHIRYVPQKGQWLQWNGHTWTWDDAGYIFELARSLARDLPDQDRDAEKHRKTSLSNRGLAAIEKLSRTDTRIVAHLDTLDSDPYALNTPTGVINLKTGTISTPTPTALHTRTTTVGIDPTMPTPRWTSFLADTFAGDPHLTAYIQRLLGVSLVGKVLEQVLPFAFGSGANGKSVLFETVQKIAGIGPNGYAATIPADMLVARSREDHPATIAQLSGVRLAIGGELEQGARFAEAKVKALTGGDPINARFMNQNPFTFIPTHTLWLHANHQPEVRTGGPAFWRRIRQLPFIHTVPEDKRIEGLEDILITEEGPGILAWLAQGAADYFAQGLDTPASVLAATEAYKHDTDTVAQFVEDRCTTGDPNAQHMHVKTSVLRAAYESWCKSEGLEPVSARALTQQLKSRHGVETRKHTAGARFYDGIRLNDIDDNADTPAPEEPDEWYQR
ncbi:phage/plasmid primase, P4 family [Timonella senegalensis]|uniref:phage/plasmid primase, P4 family n=1 Tax=Timonella senegalensis TaxID=1465825 RepID=UPI0028AC3FB3|nr:phage/plasmid primase, P4 family [Timonella senegalensis]